MKLFSNLHLHINDQMNCVTTVDESFCCCCCWRCRAQVIFLLFHTFRIQIIIWQSTKSLRVCSIFQRNHKIVVN